MNPFSRTPQWLSGALKLGDPEVPAQLDTTNVQPTIDIGQGGWSGARWLVNVQTHAANLPSTAETMVPESDTDGRLIMAVRAYHSAGAADQTVTLRYYDPVRLLEVEYASVSVPPNIVAAWTSFNPGGGPIYVPPEVRFEVLWPATGAAETWTAHYLTAIVPAGYKCL